MAEQTTSFFDQFTNPNDLARITTLIDSFRTTLHDYDGSHNILNGKVLEFSDSEVYRFLQRGLLDINKGTPPSQYTLFNFPEMNIGLIVDSAILQTLIANGMLQLRNQIDYSDSGLTVAMFNKTTLYQSWMGTMLQLYMMDKKEFKKGLLVNSSNAGFFGIGSEFGYGEW